MLVPLLDMANHAPREQANAALCDIANNGGGGDGGGGAGRGRRSKAVVALKALQAGEELLFVYESDEGGPGAGAGGRAPRSSFSSSASSGGGSLASSLRSKLGVVPTGKLVADYGFVAELDVSEGVTFLTGELERLLESLTAKSGEPAGATPTESQGGGALAPQNQQGLEAAMLLTSTMMDDFKLLKADALFAREAEGSAAGPASGGAAGGYGYGGVDVDEPLPLAPRLRLALLYRLGRTAAILRAFAEERKGGS